MNTTENNKLIAAFMGLEVGFADTSQPCILGKQNAWTPIKYHSDWNWLMEVVEKIEEKCAFVLIGRMFCEITHTNPLNTNVHFEKKLVSGVRINAVYATCVEFIQWYNQQNQ
jgi:hypothetical protein